MTVAELSAVLTQLDPSAPVVLVGPGDQRWELDYVHEETVTGAVCLVARPSPLGR